MAVMTSMVPGVGAQEEVAPDGGGQSFGVYTMSFEVGIHAVGVPLTHRALGRVVVGEDAAGGMGFSLSGRAAARFGDAIGTAGTELFVEVVGVSAGAGDALLGHRFEVNEQMSAAFDPDGGIVVFDSVSPWNTTAPIPNLAGAEVEVVPHLTLGQQFPPSELFGSYSFAQADQVQMFRNGEFVSYYVLGDNATLAEWRKVGGLSEGTMGQQVIYPGEGIYFVRSNQGGSPVTLTFSGRVRQGKFVQPLPAGLSFVAEGHPYTRSFQERGALDGSFSGSFVFKHADQVQVPIDKGYQKYYLASDGDAFSQWVQFGGDFSSQDDAPVFDFRRAVFLKRNLADPTYTLSSPWEQ